MAFDVQTLAAAATCAECLNQEQKQNVALYLLNQFVETGVSGGGLHNLLSLTHPDTVPGPPLRGSLIVGNATPDWEALLIGPANRVLRSDGVDASWSQLVLTTDVTGVLPIANGGTNSSAALNNDRIMVSSAGAIVEAAALTNGQLLIGSTGAAPVAASLTAGANITITPGAGSITIASTIGTHTILDAAVHTDSVTQAVSRGSLIYGNATPKWDELTIGATGRFLGSDGTDVSWTALPGSFSGFANPTAQVGLAAVNGVATTAMRSDAAPALSQAIAPTWTGTHIFSPATANAIQINPFGAASGNTSEFRFLELAASGTNYTGFKAADSMVASEIYVLPNAAPSANRFLRAGAVAAGVSTLTWSQISLTADVTGILPVANGGTGTSTGFTLGSVIFAGAAGVYTEDNANFFWDNTNNRLGIGAASPAVKLEVSDSGGATPTTIRIFNTGSVAGQISKLDFGGFTGLVKNSIASVLNAGGSTSDLQFNYGNNAAFTAVTIAGATGSVGIGIAVPLASLHIVPLAAPALLISPFGAAAGNTGEFRLRELTASGTNYTGFKAADAMAASEIYVLPDAAPAANRFLRAGAVAAGVSTLSWAQVSLTADVTGILPVANGGSGTSTAFTAGSVIFAGAAGVYSQDNANLFYDDSANRLTVNQLNVPNTTSATVGGIYFGAIRAIHNYGTKNLFVGSGSGNFTTTGIENGALGYNSLAANTTGSYNAALGTYSLLSNTTGSYNAAVGEYSLYSNTEGTQNIGIGFQSLFSNTTGSISAAIGFQSMFSNTTGSFNAAIGYASLYSNTIGAENIAIGYSSLFSNIEGTKNTAIGYKSGFGLTTGSKNILIGSSTFVASLNQVTTGGNNVSIGVDVAIASPTASNQLTIGNLIYGTGLDGAGATVSTGNIGIGVITPLAKLHVTNSAAATVAEIIKAAAAQSANLTEWQDSSATILSKFNSAGNLGVRMGATALTAYLHLAAGTAAASTAPLKFNTGTSMATAEAGAVEFTTDDLFFTITTGAARKRLLMADATAGLTSGKIPVATTNGRLIDLTASSAYTLTNGTIDRAVDINATSLDEVADLVYSMWSDLNAKGILG